MSIPYEGRVIINDPDDGLEISIPYKSKQYAIVISVGNCCVFLFWAIALESFAKTPLIPLSIFFSSIGLVFLVYYFRLFLWMTGGKEVITVKQGQLILNKKGTYFCKPKVCNLNEVRNFRFEDVTVKIKELRWSNPLSYESSGNICFDYGTQIVRFGVEIDEADARYILEKLAEKGMPVIIPTTMDRG